MQKYMRLVALLAAVVLVLAACSNTGSGASGSAAASGGGTVDCDTVEFGCVEVASGAPITIGTIFVLSGPNEALGTDSEIGVEVAQKLRPEIAGHTVALNSQDGLCSADGGTAAATALVAEPNIAGVIGTSCSSEGVPAAEITSREGIVLISPSNTAPSLTDPATHQPFYARTAHNDKIQGAAMAEFVCDVVGAKTAATIDDGSPYADQLAAVFAANFPTECGGTITKEEAVTVGQTDFSGVLGNIAADSPDFLYFPIFVAEGALITQQARTTAGLEDTDLGGADGILTPDWLNAAGADNAEGVYLSGPDLEFSGSFYQDEFLPAYREESGLADPISVFHAHAFDAYNILANAIEKVAFTDGGTTYIPRGALRDAVLGTSGFEGITGTLTCDANGDCANAKISVSQVQDGKFVRIWPTN